MTTNFQDDIPHLKYKIYLKVENVDGFIRHQVVMLLTGRSRSPLLNVLFPQDQKFLPRLRYLKKGGGRILNFGSNTAVMLVMEEPNSESHLSAEGCL